MPSVGSVCMVRVDNVTSLVVTVLATALGTSVLFACAENVMPPGEPQKVSNSPVESSSNEATAGVDPVTRGDVTLRDTKGQRVGSIDLAGDVFDGTHTLLGHIEVDGTVRSASDRLLGTVREDGTLLAADASPIAHVDDEGNILSPAFHPIGRIEPDGTVTDVTATTVAKVEGYRLELRIEVATFMMFFGQGSVVLQKS